MVQLLRNLLLLPVTFILFTSALKSQCTSSFTTLVDADMPPSNEGSFTKTISGQTFTFTPAAAAYVGIDDNGLGFQGLYAYDYNTANGTEITIAAPAGYSFDLNMFRYASGSDPDVNTLTMTLTFTNGSTNVEDYTVVGNNVTQNFNTFITVPNDVVSVKLITSAYISYNDFCIDDVKPFSILPLTLLSFAGAPTEQGVQLIWKTAGEVNTKSFEIQRVQTGNDFVAITEIPSNAFGGNYAYTDQFAAAGQVYLYRLKMIDQNGLFKYSPTIQVRMNKPVNVDKFTLFPNPVIGNQVSLRSNTGNTQIIHISIRDISGKTWVDENVKNAGGLYNIPVSQLPSGLYMLQIYSHQGELLQVTKMVK